MTRSQFDALLVLSVICALSVSLGLMLGQDTNEGKSDFKGIYFGSKCALKHCDPYRESELLQFYLSEGGESSRGQAVARHNITMFIYPPTVITVLAPLSLLSFKNAYYLWILLSASSLTLGAFLMWSLSRRGFRNISLLLLCVVLVDTEIIFAGGNAAGIVTGLVVIGAWCILTERFVLIGIVCLAAGLCIKPQDAVFVWLYFLLAGGVFRRRALQSLLVVGLLAIPGIVWTFHVSPHWVHELHANLVMGSGRGGNSDPGPLVNAGIHMGIILDLRSVISVFYDTPLIYSGVSYIACGAMLVVWGRKALRSSAAVSSGLLGLAVIAPLSLLSIYHRPYDSRILMLVIPGLSVLWEEGGAIGWGALLLTGGGVVLAGDIATTVLAHITRWMRLSLGSLSGELLTVVFGRSATLVLLALSIFYLWVYVRRTSDEAAAIEPDRTRTGSQ